MERSIFIYLAKAVLGILAVASGCCAESEKSRENWFWFMGLLFVAIAIFI